MRTRLFVVAAALCLTLIAGRAIAQTEQPKKPDAAKPAQPEKLGSPTAKPGEKPAPGGAGMPSPEQMQKMMEAMAPGPEHEVLKGMVGNWTCDVSFIMAPGAPPEKSSGTLKRQMIMDGRYLSEDFEGTAGGMPFKGHALVSYNRGAKQYETIWIDSMGTGIGYWTGKGDAKKITFEGDNYCAMEGKVVHEQHILEMPSKDKQVMKMIRKGPDGKDFQNFEMTCTRS
jgi:hypothetical protein